jgi:hypothetical protein
MIKRLFWFVSGIVAGVGGVLFAGRRVKRTIGSMGPVKVAGRAAEATRSRLGNVQAAFREGRDAMRDRETELRARRDGRVDHLDSGTSIDPVSPGDSVLVDGTPVAASRVIVLRQVDEPTGRRHRRRERRRP